mmetsp:Transcript_12851/g.19252  ORF Transcript_12851/g.19252 Transcript_12851/m.19252 type:complete len:771 (-) Transcript_12851:104-2416(-)
MGVSSSKRQRQVTRLLEDLFEQSEPKKKRLAYIDKIWKLVDPNKTGYLDKKRALMLIKALVRYCRTRAIRVMLASPRAQNKWSWSRKGRTTSEFKHRRTFTSGTLKRHSEISHTRHWSEEGAELEDFADFRINDQSDASEYVDRFLRRLKKFDFETDGMITSVEFRVWMESSLDNPVAAVKEVLRLEKKQLSHNTSVSIESRSTKVVLQNYRRRRRNTFSTEFDGKSPTATPSGILKDEREFINEMGLFDLCPLSVNTPFGRGHAIDHEKGGKILIHYPWGARSGGCKAHFVRTGERKSHIGKRFTYQGLELAFTVNEPGKLMKAAEVREELTLHRELANGSVSPDVLEQLTENQLKYFLPVLLRTPDDVLCRILAKNTELLRRAYWIINSYPEQVHRNYINFVRERSPDIQKLNTVRFFRDHMKDAMECTRFDSLQIFCPLFPSRLVERIDVVKKFRSGHAPALLSVEFRGLPSLPVKVIFKPDECRADAACLTMFRVFNRCWEESSLSPMPYAFTFEVCPLGKKSGVIQFIPNAVELQGYSIDKIKDLNDLDLDEFIRSAAGSYVACYIMGCRDRHKSNFMIKDDKTFLQIDFKHCFDRQTRGVDAPHFSVRRGMRKALKERSKWRTFKELCKEAFRVLRRRSQIIIRMCLMLFEGLWFTPQEIELWLIKAFRLGEIEEQAVAFIPKSIKEGVTSFQRRLKSWTHKKSLQRQEKKIKKSSPSDSRSKSRLTSLGSSKSPKRKDFIPEEIESKEDKLEYGVNLVAPRLD